MKELNFYIDDSGTRNPDKRASRDNSAGDWFALGGIIVAADQEAVARQLHKDFCERWDIGYPLHSVEIRHNGRNFAWIGRLTPDEKSRFYRELDALICEMPVHALACVIDRPGYDARYREKYGPNRWSLCKTAFSIIAERAAKYAAHLDARVRLYVERSDKLSEGMIKSYFKEIRDNGMPFASGGGVKYNPMPSNELKERLYDLKIKSKSSPMVQMADLYLYPLCKSGYQDYRPMDIMRNNGKLLEAVLPVEMRDHGGTKYSCFELADRINGPTK